MIMEENSAVVECLILFYINMKQVLKTKRLTERVFLKQMVNYCREHGYKDYSEEEIKSTWKTLVSQYTYLKNKGAVEEKDRWEYFKIFDSCYEQSDFHNGLYPKFSEEMIWLLLECFLKRKTLIKTQKHSAIISEIHTEFLKYGYTYITKQDIDKKWRALNLKYEKLKHDPESLNDLPYLQALRSFHKENEEQNIVNMVFTRELTEILIERFTQKKFTCVVRGYDSDQVLSEIQSEFKDLGFYFSKENISEKWNTLTCIYKFLISKGTCQTSWVYFDAMKNHFQNDFLFSWSEIGNGKIILPSNNRSKRLKRSKSLGTQIKEIKSKIITRHSEIIPPTELEVEREPVSEKKPVKRVWRHRRRSTARKKLRTISESGISEQKNEDEENCNKKNCETEISSVTQTDTLNYCEKKEISNLESPTNDVSVTNTSSSDIDGKSDSMTINLPSITKKFSDNEFLPLKKRSRIDDDNEVPKEVKEKLSSVHVEPQQFSKNTNMDKHLTEGEMSEILQRIDMEKSQTHPVHTKVESEFSDYYGSKNLNSHQNTYNFDQQDLLVPKEERPDSESTQNYRASNAVPQPPVLFLVINVNGNNNSTSNQVSVKTEESANPVKDDARLSEKKADDPLDTQQIKQLETVPTRIMKLISPKGKIVVLGKKKDSKPSLTANGIETSTSETVSNAITSQTNQNSPQLSQTENKQVYSDSSGSEIKNKSTFDRAYAKKENQSEPHKVENVYDTERIETSPTKTRFAVSENVSLQSAKNQTSPSKVKLPVTVGGKRKEIFISPDELSKIAKLKPEDFKVKSSLSKPTMVNFQGDSIDASVVVKRTSSGIKFMSQVIKPGVINNPTENSCESVNDRLEVDASVTTSSNSCVENKIEDFRSDRIFSKVVDDDDGLKDNLLATVIDFQEQNNQEFMEIKNLMKQNNLLQRETNRLLRIMLEK